MADDDEAIYIDVVPRLDDAETQKTSERVQDAFKGVGKKMGQAWGSELGQELRKTVGDELKPVVEEYSGKIGAAIGSGLKDFSKNLGIDIDASVEKLQNFKDSFVNANEAVGTFREGMTKLKAGDAATGIGQMADAAKKLGINANDLPEPLKKTAEQAKDLLTQFGGLKGDVKLTAESFGELTTAAPGIAAALSSIAAAAAPIAVSLLAIDKIFPNVKQDFSDLIAMAEGKIGFNLGEAFSDASRAGVPALGWIEGQLGITPHFGGPQKLGPGQGVVQQPGGSTAYTGGGIENYPENFIGPIQPGAKRAPGGARPPLPGEIAPSGNSGGVPLMQNADGTWTSPNPAWAHLIGRESSGNPTIQNNSDSNAAKGDPSQGLFQFTTATWLRMGGGQFAPHPGMATAQQQAMIAARLIRANPSGSDWGAGQPGRENAGALLAGLSEDGILPGSSPGYDNMIGILPGGQAVGLEGGEGVLNPRVMQQPGMSQIVAGLNKGYDSGTLGDLLGGGSGPTAPQNPISSIFDMSAPKGMPSDNWKGLLPGRGQGWGGGQNSQVLGQGAGGVKGQSAGGVGGQKPDGVVGQSPGGVQAGPPLGSMAPQPAAAPDDPNPPQTIIPQGQGKGFSLQGGLIGSLEGAAIQAVQAAGMGADAMGGGGGGSAAGAAASQAMQIGFQEMNRAISFGVQAGTTAAIEAPLDTFWLSDSGLSDPSHSWFGKLGLSLIGQHGSVQNMAGQTQAPLTPGQGQGSPLGGQPQKTAGPAIHIENQYNASDVDHANNNQTLAGQVAANSAVSNSAYGY